MDMLFTRSSIAAEVRRFAESQARYHGGKAIEDIHKALRSDEMQWHYPACVAFAMISAARAAGWARIALEADNIALNF